MVPGLDPHPDLAHREIAAVLHPAVAAAGPDVRIDDGLVLRLEVRGAVLEPEEVPSGDLRPGGRRGAAEAELRPPHRGGAEREPGEVADGVHRDLRVVAARLDAEVAARGGGDELLAGEGRELDERCRPVRGDAEAVAAPRVGEEGRTEPEGDREAGGGEAERLAGVIGRRLVLAAGDRAGAGPETRGHPGRRRGPGPSAARRGRPGRRPPRRRTRRSAAGPARRW